MAKFRTKGLVEAVQYKPFATLQQQPEWLLKYFQDMALVCEGEKCRVFGSKATASEGDWIIRGVSGPQICRSDRFESEYEPADPAE